MLLGLGPPTATLRHRHLDQRVADVVARLDPTFRRLPATAIVNDPRLGHDAATMLQHMRQLRNRVAHEPGVSVSPEQATGYARQALSFIGALAPCHRHRE